MGEVLFDYRAVNQIYVPIMTLVMKRVHFFGCAILEKPKFKIFNYSPLIPVNNLKN